MTFNACCNCCKRGVVDIVQFGSITNNTIKFVRNSSTIEFPPLLKIYLVNIPKLLEYEMPTDYMQNEFTVDSEGESDTSLELSSEDSDSDTETN